MRSDKIKKGLERRCYLKIQKISVFIIFFVVFIPILVRASNLNEELTNFLIRRTPTPAEDASTDNLSIEIKPEGQDKPNLFMLPRITVWAFEDYLFSKRKFEELINFCEAAKKASPDFFTIYLMAESFDILGKIDESIETYKKATEVLPDAPMPFFWLWAIYMYDKNQPMEAQENLDKFNSILQSSPEREISSAKSTLREDLMNIGNYFLNETHQFDRATKYFKMLLKMDPNFERAKLNLILCQFNKSVELRDRESFEKSLEEIRGMAGQSKDMELISFINQLLEKSKEIRKEAFGE